MKVIIGILCVLLGLTVFALFILIGTFVYDVFKSWFSK